MKAPLWVVPLLMLLLTCTPKPDDSVLPGVNRIKVFADNNQKQLYFIEDTVNNRITLDARYFNANNSVVTSSVKPQFLVNGKPFAGTMYPLTQPGIYTFTAQVGNKQSDNQIGPLTVVRVADHISTFAVKTAVSFLNADSVSRLPLAYQLTDKQGKSLDYRNYALPTLLVNGVRQGAADAFVTGKAGQYTLQTEFFGIQSNPLTVIARKPTAYPVVRLPIVIHVPKSANASNVDPASILAYTNKAFRKAYASVDPNQADASVEFFPAKTDPDGRPLAVAGLHRLDFDNPATAEEASALVTNVLHRWCPQQYINVFVSVDWLRTYPAGYSFSYLPNTATETNLPRPTCDDLKAVTWGSEQIPAIYINGQDAFTALAHELGHFFSLQHTFAPGCSARRQVSDTPKHQEARPTDGTMLKYTCDQTPFLSDYVMDYYVTPNSFTYEQVGVLRNQVQYGTYVPNEAARKGGRRGVNQTFRLETGRTVSCVAR